MKAKSYILFPHDYALDFVNMVCDQIDIPNIEQGTPKDFVIRCLIRDGHVGYLDTPDASRGHYGSRYRGQRARFGLYENFFFRSGADGQVQFPTSAKYGARDIRANASAVPLFSFFQRCATLLDICDRSIAANIRAQIYGRVITARDSDTEDKIMAVIDALESGRPLVLDETEKALLASYDISIPATFDAVIAARSAIWAEAMKRCGSVSANQYRHERTQTAEVDAAVAETIDAVYIMINTYNDDCKRQNILGTDGKPLHMVFTGYAARFDEDPEQTQATPEETEESGA